MKLNIGDKVMVKARGEYWNFDYKGWIEGTVMSEPTGGEICIEGPNFIQQVPISAIKPIKKPFRLKDGKKYETADGRVFKVRKHPEYENIWDINDDTSEHWHYDGTSFMCHPDLIRRHYTKPQPAHKLDLQKGDVVELVMWEDEATAWIGETYSGELHPIGFNKGERPLFRVVSRQGQSS